jgi:Rod binding domain-containing protein
MHIYGKSVQSPQPDAAEAAPNPKLVRAAHEFEGQMMKELLRPMVGSDALGGEDDDSSGLGLGSGSGSGGALSDFASETLGQALSQHGGFGIADQIIHELSRHELSRHGNPRGTSKVTAPLHGDTVMRRLQ